jgi:hypothetical protein
MDASRLIAAGWGTRNSLLRSARTTCAGDTVSPKIGNEPSFFVRWAAAFAHPATNQNSVPPARFPPPDFGTPVMSPNELLMKRLPLISENESMLMP